MAGMGAAGQDPTPAGASLKPGEAVGISLISGDFAFGATGTVTDVEDNRVFAV